LGPLPHYRFLYSVPSEKLSDLAYDFEYRYADGRDPQTYAKALGEAIEHWREVKVRAAKSLSYRRGPGFLIVQDRRPGFETADYRFDGAEAKICLACDAGATAAEIYRQFVAEGDDAIDVVEIENYLKKLVEARLMYREGKAFLSLAVAVSSARIPLPTQSQVANTSALFVMVSG